ncbi:hypothetical protein D9M69_507320 [compost metagenome]
MHHRVGAALDTGRRALLVDQAAEGFHSRGFTQGQIERMDVTTAHVQHAADIVVGGDDFTDALGVQQFQLVVAEAFPELLLGFQVTHLLLGEGCEYTAVLQVALDVVLLDAVANDAAAFEGHVGHQPGVLRIRGALDSIDVAAVAVDDLAAVAT